MGGLAEGLACADPGARTPIGASGNSITLFIQFQKTTPTNQPPAWMSKELLSLADVMQTRLAFLTALASKPTPFTTTPEEMVKIFAHYMQAQGASYGRSGQPARVMESIIKWVEHARHRGQRPAAELPISAAIPPLMSVEFAAPVQAPAPPGNAIPRVAASPQPVINPMFDASQPDNSITWRGDAGGRRGR